MLFCSVTFCDITRPSISKDIFQYRFPQNKKKLAHWQQSLYQCTSHMTNYCLILPLVLRSCQNIGVCVKSLAIFHDLEYSYINWIFRKGRLLCSDYILQCLILPKKKASLKIYIINIVILWKLWFFYSAVIFKRSDRCHKHNRIRF